jgi:hypothetical protein
MIDPIGSVPVQRLMNSTSVSQTGRSSKEKSTTIGGDEANSLLSKKSIQDQVTLSMDLQGDLEQLQNSVTTVSEQIKVQLEQYYGLRNEEGDSSTDIFYPPEDSSAEDIIDFFSPENTANRILGFTTSFFDDYLGNHEDESEEENVNGFTSLIGDAIKKGFEEAEEILGDFDQLGEIGETIQKTYQLVLEGLEEYRLNHLNSLGLEDSVDEDSADDDLEEPSEIVE